MRRRPDWIADLLRSCPSTGNGVHNWLHVVALKLHRYFPDKNELAQLLREATAHCGREVTDREIDEAIKNSRRLIENSNGDAAPMRRWPNRDEQRIKDIVSAGPSLAEFTALSPVRWTDGSQQTEQVIDELFPGNPLLCAGPSQRHSITQTREQWCGRLARQQFIVPSPMTERFGETQSGTMSMRSLANTGPRRFIVIEFDSGSFDAHAALLNHLWKFAPLVLAVHSANKSLHGWFACGEQPEQTIEKFFRYAVSLGADRATWTRGQLVRMPDGERENGKIQRVVFF